MEVQTGDIDQFANCQENGKHSDHVIGCAVLLGKAGVGEDRDRSDLEFG